MKASYNWLKDYCDFELPVHELAERLSHSGLSIESYEPRGADWMLDLEVKSNRPDCLSLIGIAREVAAITGGTARRPDFTLDEDPARPFSEAVEVQVDAPDLCPHYTVRVITGVKVGPSPQWLQDRLATCGVRAVNNLVDATNYVMLESGQPLHAFDYSVIGGRRIVVRRARPGEVITTIDGAEHELTGDECVIADQFKAIALAGVMGGTESEIHEATTGILLESARFDPRAVRRTSRRHGLSSESSYRFERGIDPEITDWASRRACQLILELAGGALLCGSAQIRSDRTETPEVTLRFSRLSLVLGLDVPQPEVTRILRALQLDVVRQDDASVTVRVPSWRSDLGREVDLIEEVARIYGYDKIGETTEIPVRAVAPSVAEVAERRTRRLLAGEGFNEVMTYSLMVPSPVQLAQPWHEGDPLGVRNPISAERTHLRLTNMANLLAVKQFNQAHGAERVDLFELGRVYIPRDEGEQPEEKLCLSLLTDRDEGLRVLKGVLTNLMDELGVEAEIEQTPQCAGPFRLDDSIALRIENQLFGCAGIVAESFANELDLRSLPALMEVDFLLLSERCRLHKPYRPVAPYPATRRDLAIVVGEEVLWADMEQCIQRSASDILESVELFDVYRGTPVPKGRKSVAFSLTFRRHDRTITAAEAEQARTAILSALQQEFDAVLR